VNRRASATGDGQNFASINVLIRNVNTQGGLAMNRLNLNAVAGVASGVLLGLLLAFQAGAQAQSGGARPSGATSGAGHAGGLGNAAIGVDHGWPRAPEVQPPSRLPEDKAFGEKGKEASANKATNASSADCAEAKAAIAAAGTGGNSGKGRGGASGADGRAKAAEAVCSGANAEVSTDAGQSTEAPGHTGVTGQAQAIQRANEHAEDGLEKAQSNQKSDEKPEQGPPQ
jgi:hypothetical protein